MPRKDDGKTGSLFRSVAEPHADVVIRNGCGYGPNWPNISRKMSDITSVVGSGTAVIWTKTPVSSFEPPAVM